MTIPAWIWKELFRSCVRPGRLLPGFAGFCSRESERKNEPDAQWIFRCHLRVKIPPNHCYNKLVMEFLRYRNLLKHLVLKDLKLKYRYSFLGFLWSLVNPILMIIVYTFAFKYILKNSMADYTVFLLAGLLPWNFFAMSSQDSTSSIVGNMGLIRKQVFPLEILPIATVFFDLFLFLMALLALLPAGFVMFGITPKFSFSSFFVLLFLQTIFTIGVSLFLSAATVFFRDVRHLTEVFLMVFFWLTPVVYEWSNIPKPYNRWIFYLNPMGAFILGYQNAIFQQTWPAHRTIFVAACYAAAALALGWLTFRKYKPYFAEIA